jgi:RHS repeat-associated protein
MRGVLLMLAMHIVAIGLPASAQDIASANSGFASHAHERWNRPLHAMSTGALHDRGATTAMRACSTSTGILSPCTASATVATGATGRTYQFDLNNNTDFQTLSGGLSCQVTAPVISCSLSPTTYSISPGFDALITVTYAVSSTVGTGTVKLVTGGGLGILTGTLTVTTTNSGGVPIASITPHTGTATTTSGSLSSQVFVLKNTGTVAGGFSFAVTCVAPATVCGTPAPIASLGSLATSNVSVGYTGGSVGSGTIKLVAIPSVGTAKDSGTVTTTVTAPPCTSTSGAMAPCASGASFTGAASAQTFFASFHNTTTGLESGNINCSFIAPVTSCSVNPTAYFSIAAGYTQTMTVTYSVGNIAATGSLTVSLPSAGVASVLTVTESQNFAVAVTPDGQALAVPHNTSQTAPFTVTNNGNTSATYTITTNCSGTGVTCSGVSRGSLTLSPGQSDTTTLSFVSGATGTAGSAGITATFGTTSDNGSYAVTSHILGVIVSPVASMVVAPASTTRTANFNVTNTSDVQVAFAMTTTCASPSLASCSVTSPDTIGAGVTATVPVTFTTSATNTVSGPLKLTATYGTVTATGTMTVTTPTPTPMAAIASVSTVNPGEQVARDLCLTVSAGNDAAYECGDLRLVHPFTTVRTKNKARTPTLLYTSAHAQPLALVAVSVSLSDSSSKPDQISVDMALTDGSGRHPVLSTWGATSQWAPGVTRRLVLGFDAAAYPSGVYPYTLTLTSYFGAITTTTPVSGTLLIVNRKTSPFGAGWWLAGLEQLTPINGDLFWIGGDGSARIYHAVTAGTKWGAFSVDRPDTITFSAGTYTRIAEHGVRVQFNSAGQHVSTTNRLGDVTTFTYTSGRLTTITVPPATAPASYTFTYANANTTLSTVKLTAGTATRTTTVTNPTGTTISGFADPDSTSIALTYVSGTARAQTRTDRRLHTTTYFYDAGGKLSQVSVAMASPAPAIVTKFRALESWGLAGQASATPTNSYSLLDGPRNDVGDSTRIFLDRFGAPQRIFNALGDSTVMLRADARFPALVTQLRRANGFTSNAAYDARGNLQQSTDLSPFGTSVNVTTSLKWDTSWDFVARIDRSGGLPSDTMSYDTHGNRLWQQTGPDAERRVTFTYDPTTLLVASVQTALQASLGPTVAQHVTYNASGNVATITSPTGLVDSLYSDLYGRDTLVASPLDLAQTQKRRNFTVYDAVDRVIQATSVGPARNGQLAESTLLVTKYDQEGYIVSTRRSALPDAAKIGTMWDTSVYDFAQRRVKAIAVDGMADSMIYDPAGNLVTTITRRGLLLTSTFDSLNRLTRRVTSSVTYPKVTDAADGGVRIFPRFPNTSNFGLTLPVDTEVFAYDAAGNLLRADNNAALVRRSYLPGGLVATDTEVVRNYNTDPTTKGDTLLHRYGLQYSYDDAGRRTTLRHPATQAAGTTGITSYGYDPIMGQLQQITDPLGNVFTLTEDADSRPVRTLYPGGVRDTTVYDSAGDPRKLVTLNTTTRGVYFYPVDTLYSAVLTREAQGRVTHATVGGLVPTPADMSYGGLGELKTSATTSSFGVYDWIQDSTSTGTSYEGLTLNVDALGNQVSNARTTSTTVGPPIGYVEQLFTDSTRYSYDSSGIALGRGRLRMRTLPQNAHGGFEFESLQYDLAGNLVRDSNAVRSSAPDPANIQTTLTHSYYDALNQLRVVDRSRVGFPPPGINGYSYEEYSYDALGRRVLVRSRIFCDPAVPNDGRCASKVRRTIWDGSEELWEIQDDGNNVSVLENETPDTTLLPLRIRGRVLYVNGTGVDHPLGIIRFAYEEFNDGSKPRYTPGPFLTVPHYTWRGAAEFATYADGSGRMCQTGSTLNCLQSAWPTEDAFQGRRFSIAWPEWSWLGTSLEGKTEAGSGLQYKRNRYYDPSTGRFTQEDPIGLAGGLNTYGFAGGDPVNFDDPFGLDPCLDKQRGNCTQAQDGKVGQHNEKIIAGLTPAMQDKVRAMTTAAGQAGHTLWLVYGRRSLELQQQMYERYLNGGPLAAPPGQSAHNYGLAVDLAYSLPNGSGPDWRSNWNIIGATAAAVNLYWLGPIDQDHVQIARNWRKFKP